MVQNNKKINETILSFISDLSFILQRELKKYRAFKRGLETSRNVGYLFYYFLTM